MLMLAYILPIVLVVASNVFYNISTKSMPGQSNPFVGLFVTYLVAAAIAAVLMFVVPIGKGVAQSFKSINWTSFVLGICVVGLEFGYVMAYRAGWNISVGSLVANISLAIILIPVGLLLYRERIGVNQIIGIALCIVGLIFINKK